MRTFLRRVACCRSTSATEDDEDEALPIPGVDNIFLHGGIIRKQHPDAASAKHEYDILLRLAGVPNCVKVLDILGKSIYLEYLKGGALIEYLNELPAKKLTLAEAATVGLQICNAIGRCHELGIAHLDLKLDNICLRNGLADICVIDFGGSEYINSQPIHFPGSTYTYISPELIQFMGYADLGITLSSRRQYIDIDIWCIGIILYSMLTGRSCPFLQINSKISALKQQDVIRNVAALSYTIPDDVDASIAALLREIFVHDGTRRPRIAVIEQTLRQALEKVLRVARDQ